jgi:hypothetical protein
MFMALTAQRILVVEQRHAAVKQNSNFPETQEFAQSETFDRRIFKSGYSCLCAVYRVVLYVGLNI